MIQFEFVARNGAKLLAHYAIKDGRLTVQCRGRTMSVVAGVNEIANAFLRDNLMRLMLGEIDMPEKAGAGDAAPLGSNAA